MPRGLDAEFARRSLHAGWVSAEEIDEARARVGTGAPDGAVAAELVRRGRVDVDRFSRALAGLSEAQRFGEVAVEQKYLDPKRLDEALAIQEAQRAAGPGEMLGQILLRKGWIAPEQFVDVLRRQGTRRAPGAESPPRRFGRYEIQAEVGRGGAGVVYRAYDPQLSRTVALKTLHAGPEAGYAEIQRFLREAQIAAGLRHPGIVPVHDVGEIDGTLFFTMDHIDGTTLEDEIGRGLALRPAAGLIAKTARILHHAHERGVVHRDLKPSNVLIDRDQEPHLVDFGLARTVKTESSLTRSGSILGTPFYMSPEHVTGKTRELDARSDVYSLGVILYEAVTGTLPFLQEDMIELFRQIATEEPVPPSRIRRRVPRDLERIILKAIAKDPARRYATAEAMADDLERYLRGEPVMARAPSFAYKLSRRVRRNPAAAGLAGALVLVVAAGVAAGAWLLMAAARRGEASALAEQAGRHLIGGDIARAEELANRAGALDPANVQAYYWRGRAALERYLAARPLPRAWKVEGLIELAPPPPETPAERALRESFEADFRRASAEVPAAGAVAAFFDGRYAEAREGLDRIEADTPALRLLRGQARYFAGDFEAAREGTDSWELRLRATLALALARETRGDDPLLLYAEVIEQAAGLERLQLWDASALAAEAHIARGNFRASRGEDPEEDFAQAFAEDPLLRGDALLGLARYRRSRGRVSDEFERALAEYDRAVERAPADAAARLKRALAFEQWADHLREVGRDHGGVLLSALADYEAVDSVEALLGRARTRFLLRQEWEPIFADIEAALNRRPDHARAWLARAEAHRHRGNWHEERGREPEPDWDLAERDYAGALGRNAAFVEAYVRRGELRTRRGLREGEHGRDPEALWAAAREDFTRALDLNPRHADAWGWRANLSINRGAWLEDRGEDPMPAYDEAIADEDQALAIHPTWAPTLISRSLAHADRAWHLLSTGRDPRAEFDLAIDFAARAIAANGQSADAYYRRGYTFVNRGFAAMRLDEDPSPFWESAEEDLLYAAVLNPGNADAFYWLGTAYLNQGVLKGDMGGDSLSRHGEAIRAFGRTLAINPRFAPAFVRRGMAWTYMAGDRIERGEDAGEAWTEAEADFAQAEALNPALVELYLGRGTLYTNRGAIGGLSGVDPREDYARAEADYTRAIDLNPNDAEAHVRRGNNRGRTAMALAERDPASAPAWWAKAADDYERAIGLNPNLRGELEARIRTFRERAAGEEF